MRIKYGTPLKAAFDFPKVLEGPYVGIELEYEGATEHLINYEALTRWSTAPDHSLRNGGLEFVSKPLGKLQIPAALAQVKKAIIDSHCMINKRCGVHVHLNVTDLTFFELWKIVTYYTAIEPFVFKHFADGREDSHFCVPMWQNTVQQVNLWQDAVTLHRGVDKRPANNPQLLNMPIGMGGLKKTRVPLRFLKAAKYTAMNMQSIMRFGTLEFRQLYGTTDMRKVQKWVTFLIQLRERALEFSSPSAIAETLMCEGYAALLPEVGLEETGDINPMYVNDAIDAAILCVGHEPTDPEVFDWEI